MREGRGRSESRITWFLLNFTLKCWKGTLTLVLMREGRSEARITWYFLTFHPGLLEGNSTYLTLVVMRIGRCEVAKIPFNVDTFLFVAYLAYDIWFWKTLGFQ